MLANRPPDAQFEYAVNEILARERELTAAELIETLFDRTE